MIYLLKLPIDLIRKIRFSCKSNRLGPDMIFTHWMLHFSLSMTWLCRRKFRAFAEGADFRPGAYAFYTENIALGERVVIRPGTVLGADPVATITIEDDVLIGMNTHLYANDHRFDSPEKPISEQGYSAADIKICKGCWVGANVTILSGVTVGENAVVAAGAVVTRDVPSGCVAGGVPAKIIKRIS
jgi:acetyltransferase-like isoleucine patch superfamily enzyme